jgi:hypothetical protein
VGTLSVDPLERMRLRCSVCVLRDCVCGFNDNCRFGWCRCCGSKLIISAVGLFWCRVCGSHNFGRRR